MEIWAQREFLPATLPDGDDESPGLERVRLDHAEERLRLARAERAELELKVRREQFIDIDDFLAWYDVEVAVPIRKSLERLQVTHGKSAADIVLQAIDTASEAVSERAKTNVK